jgi:hypothetical protein
MRDQDAGEAVDAGPLHAAKPGEDAGKVPGAAVERQYAERRDDRRQRQRHGEELQDQAAAGKGRMPRQSARHQECRSDREQRRQQCLPQREARDTEEIAIEGGESAGKVVCAFENEADEGAADEQRDCGERDDTGGDAGVTRGVHAAPCGLELGNAAFLRAPLWPAGHLPL